MVKNEDMITRFDAIHERDRQQDGQTDTARRHRPHFSIALCAKNVPRSVDAHYGTVNKLQR